MVKGVNEGDTVSLRARVQRVWNDGTVTVHIEGYDTNVTLPEDAVELVEHRKAQPKEPGRTVRYEIGVVETEPSGKTYRVPIATADTREEAEAIREQREAVWIDEIEVKPPKKKR